MQKSIYEARKEVLLELQWIYSNQVVFRPEDIVKYQGFDMSKSSIDEVFSFDLRTLSLSEADLEITCRKEFGKKEELNKVISTIEMSVREKLGLDIRIKPVFILFPQVQEEVVTGQRCYQFTVNGVTEVFPSLLDIKCKITQSVISNVDNPNEIIFVKNSEPHLHLAKGAWELDKAFFDHSIKEVDPKDKIFVLVCNKYTYLRY
ncbi:MAG: hypothetical protein WD512_02290, partial [Candidatus Paceibacterota bacterium]